MDFFVCLFINMTCGGFPSPGLCILERRSFVAWRGLELRERLFAGRCFLFPSLSCFHRSLFFMSFHV